MEQGTILFDRSVLNDAGGYIEAKIEWSAKGVIETNRRKLTLKLYCRKGNDSMTLTVATGGIWRFTLQAGAETLRAESPSDTRILLDWVKLYEVTLELANDADGLLTIPIGGSVTAPDGTGYEGLSSTGQALTVLGRVERIGILLSVSDAVCGSFVSVRWQPRSTAFYHRLRIAIADRVYDTAVMKSDHLNIRNASLALPAEAAYEITDAAEGALKVTLITYGDALGSDLIGEESVTVTASVPETADFLPTVTMTLTPDNTGLPDAFADLYIQGITRVKAVFTAVCRYGAVLAAQALDAGASGTDIPPASGQVSVIGHITDSRGMKAQTEEVITVLSYSAPRLLPPAGENGILCYRCDAMGNADAAGTCLRVEAETLFSPLNNKNTCSFSLRSKSEGEDYGDSIPLAATNGVLISDPIPGFAAHRSYTVQVTVSDLAGGSHTVTLNVPTGYVDLHLGKGGGMAAFGKYAERKNALEISPLWDLYLKGHPLSDFTVETGQTDGWHYRRHLDGSIELHAVLTVTPAGTDSLAGWYLSDTLTFPLPYGVKNAIVQASTDGAYLPIECTANDSLISLCLLSPTAFGNTETTLMLTVRGEESQ